MFIFDIFKTSLQIPYDTICFISFDKHEGFNIPNLDNNCTTNAYKYENKIKNQIFMMVVGQVSSQEEAKEITFIAKLFVVGQRARVLAQQMEK